jgi:hypothetical protein
MRCRIQTALATFIAVVAIATTATSATATFSYGTIQSSCAPWDGPAIGITLTSEPAQCKRISEPFISIGIWRGLPIQEGNCERAQSGTITFDRYEVGSGASGRYELHFKGDETLNGTFDVKWCQERVICG